MKVERPIIIVGVGRSGSSVFHEIFCDHPKLAWLSLLAEKYPTKPKINRFLLNVQNYPIVGRRLKERYRPAECYELWERHIRGFRRPIRDLTAEDLTIKAKKSITAAMEQVLTPKRSRLLLKITGWPRLGMLHEIYPDARYIHVVRDGRSVANSMLNVDWWWGWRGPQNWRWGDLMPEQYDLWNRYDRSFVALAGIQWNILMEAMDRARPQVPAEQFLDVKYEDLCADPLGTFRAVAQFCQLDWNDEFAASIGNHELRNTNKKVREELTPAQNAMLDDVMRPYLTKYGYLRAEPATHFGAKAAAAGPLVAVPLATAGA